jgi:hypothetical protein
VGERMQGRNMAAPNRSSVITTAGNAGDVVDTATEAGGTVVLRGLLVALDTDVGRAFIADCARNIEGLTSDHEIKAKYELSDADWEQLASNVPLLHSVRAERARRILSGEAPKEAAQRHFTKAPAILNNILTDEQVSPRHRIEAARKLRQVAGSGPERAPTSGEKFLIVIDLGGDEKIVFEKTRPPLDAIPTEDGEM